MTEGLGVSAAGIGDNLQASRFRNAFLSPVSSIKLRPTLLILIFLALVVPLLAFSVLRLEGPRIRSEALANLDAIGRLKSDQIETWLNERHGDAEVLMQRNVLVDDVQRWFEHADASAGDRIARNISTLQRAYRYESVELLDARMPYLERPPAQRALLAQALASGKVQTSALYRDQAGEIWLDFATPLIKNTPAGPRPLGALLLHTRASTYLFPLIQSWPTASRSAETLLVRRDGDSVLFLNELRYRQGTSLNLRLPLSSLALPAAIAVRENRAQTLEGHDYRGVPVLAAVRPVRGTDWLLVAKVDLNEVQRPLYQLVLWVALVAFVAIVAVGFTLRRLWRQQAQSHRLEMIAQTAEKDRLLNLFYDLPFMGMGIVEPESRRWLHVNDRMCEILGYSRDELLSLSSCEQLTHPGDLALEMVELRRLLAGEIEGYQMEKRFHRKDDGFIDVALSVKCVRRDDGKVEYLVKTVRDITDRKRLAFAMREQQRTRHLLEAIADTSTDPIFVKDIAGNYLFYNRAAACGLNRSVEEVIGHNDQALYSPEQAAQIMAMDREVMDGDEPVTFEETLSMVDGDRIFLTTKGPLRDAEGKVIGLYGIARDITERKQADRALREREEDLNRAQLVGHIGSWRLDVRRNELIWSAENHRIFGIAEGSTLTYETFLSCVHPDDRELVDQAWQAGLRGETYDIQHRLLVDGELKWVRERAELEFDQEGNLLGGFGITQDITDIKAAEQALRDSEARLQLATEIGRSGTWDWNVRSGEIIWSRGHYEILGYRVGEVESGYQAWADRVHRDDRAWVEAEIQRSMQERIDYVVEFRVVWPDASIHWMSSRGRYEYDPDGTCRRMIGVMADITTLKQAELALREADQRKDEFLAMLAHELRNPLAPIRNAAHVLGRLDLAEPRLRWAQDIIERQVSHLAHLVDELLDVSRIVQGKIVLKKARIELPDLIRQACESVQPIMSAKGHRFDVHMPVAPVVVEGDLVRLVQILQNLLNNAAKYTPDCGCIELHGRLLGADIEIEVRDNGMGITSELLPVVFDLFRQGNRTLDRSQGGLGIGLTLVRQLVRLHGGQVSASSRGPGQGASFVVRLPLAASVEPASVLPDAARGTAAPGRSLRVLVVEDDPVVAESMVVFLEMEGYPVRSAAAAEAALEMIDAFRPQVALIDIGLPGQDGYALAARIRQRADCANLILLAVSGYGHAEAVQRSRQVGFEQHLVKPVEPEKLCAILAEVALSDRLLA